MPTDFDNLVLRESPDAVVVLSLDGKIVHWTKGAENVFGYSGEEALGKSLSDNLIHGDRRNEDRRRMQTTVDEGSYSYESIRRAKGGSLVYVDISTKTAPGKSSQSTFVLASQKDVTEMKALRDARLIEAKFREVPESIPDGKPAV